MQRHQRAEPAKPDPPVSVAGATKLIAPMPERFNHVYGACHACLHQLKIMSAIEHCRSGAMGGHVEAYTDCGHWRIA